MKKVGLVLILLASGCATMTHRGVVAMKVSDTEAHVGMGSDEIAVGDHLELYRNVCKPPRGRSNAMDGGACEKKELGHGVVSQIINSDYSVIKFDAGVKFSEGDMVEKHPH